VDGSIILEETTLDAAKSSIVYGVAKNVSTASSAAFTSFMNQSLRGVPRMHQVNLLEKYQAVTKADVLTALETHFLPLFDSSTSVAVVATAPSKSQEIGDGLTAAGFDVEQRTMEVSAEELEALGSEGSDMESGEESGDEELEEPPSASHKRIVHSHLGLT